MEINAASRSYSQSTISGSIGTSGINGTVDTVSTDNSAIQMVKARYDVKFADLKAQIDSLYLPKQSLLALKSQWITAYNSANAVLRRSYVDAKSAELQAASDEAFRQRQLAAQATATQPAAWGCLRRSPQRLRSIFPRTSRPVEMQINFPDSGWTLSTPTPAWATDRLVHSQSFTSMASRGFSPMHILARLHRLILLRIELPDGY